jgi:hypothetical protein
VFDTGITVIESKDYVSDGGADVTMLFVPVRKRQDLLARSQNTFRPYYPSFSC